MSGEDERPVIRIGYLVKKCDGAWCVYRQSVARSVFDEGESQRVKAFTKREDAIAHAEKLSVRDLESR